MRRLGSENSQTLAESQYLLDVVTKAYNASTEAQRQEDSKSQAIQEFIVRLNLKETRVKTEKYQQKGAPGGCDQNLKEGRV